MTQGFGRDLKLAARRLLATPLFTIFAVLSLAIGVGVTTAVYSVVDGMFWKKLVVRDAGHVVFVASPETGRLLATRLSRPDYDDLRASQTSFASIAAARRVSVAMVLPSTTELLNGEAVEGGYFSTLGVGPALGRVIQPADDQSRAEVVVLSHALWRSRFASDPRAVGQQVRLSGRSFEIIGVAAESFEGPDARFGPYGSRIWIPLGSFAALQPVPARASTLPERDRRRFTIVGRLRPGVDGPAASRELSTIAASLDSSAPQRLEWGPRTVLRRGWAARSLADIAKDDDLTQRFGLILVGLVALVLVVACTNLANLVLARGTMRHHEFAVRRALGASRGRLVREQCAESLIIAAAGAVASYVTLQGLRYLMTTEFPMTQRWTLSIAPDVDLSALMIAGIAVLLSLLVFGLEPALSLTRSGNVRGDLAASGHGLVGVPKANRQRTLLRWQVAISAGFFIIATMCVKYSIAEVRHDPGIDMSRLGIATLDFYTQGWDETRVRRAIERIVDETTRQRGVEAVTVSTGLPFGTTGNPSALLGPPDRPLTDERNQRFTRVVAATPSLFRTLGVRILRGRALDHRDVAGAPQTAVVSEGTALALFGTLDATGRDLQMKLNTFGGDQPVRRISVVGVARETDATYLGSRRYGVIYLPLEQQPFQPFLNVTARGSNATEAVRALQAAIRKADPDVAVAGSGTAMLMLAGPYAFLRAAGFVALGLGALTLLLAMVGLFGIQSHTVAFRTREIGVRMTFGASAAQIKRMVLKDGYKPVLQGLAIGVFIGFAGRAIIRTYLDAKISLLDPWMFLIVPIPLILAAFCACYLPARRASRVDPQVALRHL